MNVSQFMLPILCTNNTLKNIFYLYLNYIIFLYNGMILYNYFIIIFILLYTYFSLSDLDKLI